MQAEATYSDAELRIRIKATEQKYQQEIESLQDKIRLVKAIQQKTNDQFHDASEAGLKLAIKLGFRTVQEAQAQLELADYSTEFKTLGEQIEQLQGDVLQERKKNDKLCVEICELQQERSALKAELDISQRRAALLKNPPTPKSPSKSSRILEQLHDLQGRYDRLVDVKKRAETRYKETYARIKAFKLHLYDNEMMDFEEKYRLDAPGLSAEERKRRWGEVKAMKRRKHLEFDSEMLPMDEGDDYNDFCVLADLPESNKENQETPVPLKRKRPLNIRSRSPIRVVSAPGSVLRSNATTDLPSTVVASKLPSLSPANVASSRVPLHFEPIHSGKAAQPMSSPASVTFLGNILVPGSSDTEEESSLDPFLSPVVPPNPPLERQTKQDQPKLLPTSIPDSKPQLGGHPTLPPRPSFDQFDIKPFKGKSRHSDAGAVLSHRHNDPAEERPRKMRRVSSPGPGRRASAVDPGASAATPLYVPGGDTPRRRKEGRRDMSVSTGGRAKDFGNGKAKERQRERQVKAETSTPVNANARASSSKQLADYSSYKGRGRYANGAASGDTTINAIYAIDSSRNGGRDFQYEEVVRGREDRRQMEAGDCECCREYYEAIGPMPNRLQAPLWRSPSNSPTDAKPCLRTGADSMRRESAAITSHKQAISRHRHHWVRASTPPGYWNIGFPNTQEAADINEKAKEMHRQKKDHVEAEAEKGGRYKKR